MLERQLNVLRIFYFGFIIWMVLATWVLSVIRKPPQDHFDPMMGYVLGVMAVLIMLVCQLVMRFKLKSTIDAVVTEQANKQLLSRSVILFLFICCAMKQRFSWAIFCVSWVLPSCRQE